jgi:hypothetical protein
MYTVSYYKFGLRWYLDAPEYLEGGGSAEDLERIGAFRDFLELAAEGGITAVFHMDTQPFAGADRFELVGSSGGNTGGYYHLQSFRGQTMDLELWLNTIIYLQNATLPQTIYFKRILPP